MLKALIRFLLPVTLVCGAFALPSAAAAAPRSVDFGAWTPGSPFGGDLSATGALQGTLKRRVKVVHWFQDWNVDAHHFRHNVSKSVRAIRRSGRTPLLTWEPYVPGPWENWSNAAIANGAYDDYIRFWARGMKKLKRPVYVRLAHEFNGTWYPWAGPVNNNSTKSFKRMWRHVVDVARDVGATNVKWVWCPLVTDVPATRSNRFERYYPGKRYVDVLATDGYNWGTSRPDWGGWRSFKSIFKRGYKRLSRLGPQPIWIAEVGTTSSGGDKSAWVRKMWRVAARWDRLKAIVWFNQDGDADWSAVSAAAAFHKR